MNPTVQERLMPLMMKLCMISIVLIATPSMGLVFLLHHLTDDVMARYATNSGKENDVNRWPTIELYRDALKGGPQVV